ncbi:General stress protein 69 [Aquimixticola soesokkakensis]|uniref:General stress protein 69 n=1 Tax=Aquimixticola soesokkakensis TaxID=1519096 RepID=A0A1Y5SKI5_9RHOB|nr:aldo/keto reductase [Aquimixticola soesokkakensis]SLN41695.1 General stress protein 69 [Aquimixticola soesokkakensis]
MEKRTLGRSGLSIAPLVFGGNVFGWTADETTSFKLLDGFVDAGLDAIDTADVYSAWADGNTGGESETVIGNWLAANPAKRDKITLITKVGSQMPDGAGLSARWIERAVEDSLSRLKTDYIDLYLSHFPDPDTPYAETLAAYDKLIQAGKVRAVGGSNLDAAQLEAAQGAAKQANLPRYEVLQPEYNLYDRAGFEGPLARYCVDNEIGVITYFSLAAGFLTGKYRRPEDVSGQRARMVGKYLDDKGLRLLDALDTVAQDTGASHAEIALAWLMRKEGVTAPIASASKPSQLETLVKAVDLDLSEAAMTLLNDAG